MARQLPNDLPELNDDLSKQKTDAGRITQTRKYRLITPLFGGGVEAKKADPVKVIRETSIRGQLRFWWRAMRGFGTLAQMKEREDEIWGNAGTQDKPCPSQVALFIKLNPNGKIDKEGESKKPFFMNPNNPRPEKGWEKLAYAAFSLQPTTDEIKKGLHLPMKSVCVGVEFKLEIQFLEIHRSEIEAALWAWETFGGIGGRTRRGFGALELLEIEENGETEISEKWKTSEIEEKIREKLQTEENGGLLADGIWDADAKFPHLAPDSELKIKPAADGKEALENLIERLKTFRQSRPQTRNKDKIDYGRSYWSEPDAIRHRFIKAFPADKAKLVHLPEKEFDDSDNVDKFPRAAFGLPIIFHFMVKREDKEAGLIEPDDTELKPVSFDRLASPLILRPLACSDGTAGLALILETPRLSFDVIHLVGSKTRRPIDNVETDLTVNEANQIKPLQNLMNKIDILKAFLETL